MADENIVNNNSTCYFNSNSIKMYPSSKRSDAYDRNSRLTTEQNIISLVNRLTSRNAFIIDGMSIDLITQEDFNAHEEINAQNYKYKLTAGSCNIHGYLFNLTNDYYIENGLLATNNNRLALAIVTKVTQVQANDGSHMNYEELVTSDLSAFKVNINENNTYYLNNPSSIQSNQLLDDDSNNPKFTGLSLVSVAQSVIDSKPSINGDGNEFTKIYYLPLAVITEENNALKLDPLTWNRLKIDANDIYIKATNNPQASDEYAKEQGLFNWLDLNYVIDDGEITVNNE